MGVLSPHFPAEKHRFDKIRRKKYNSLRLSTRERSQNFMGLCEKRLNCESGEPTGSDEPLPRPSPFIPPLGMPGQFGDAPACSRLANGGLMSGCCCCAGIDVDERNTSLDGESGLKLWA